MAVAALLIMTNSLQSAEQIVVAISSEDPNKVYDTFLSPEQLKARVKFDAKTAVKIDKIEDLCRKAVSDKAKYPVDLSKWALGSILLLRQAEGDYYIVSFDKHPAPPPLSKLGGKPPRANGNWKLVCLTDGTIVHPRY